MFCGEQRRRRRRLRCKLSSSHSLSLFSFDENLKNVINTKKNCPMLAFLHPLTWHKRLKQSTSISGKTFVLFPPKGLHLNHIWNYAAIEAFVLVLKCISAFKHFCLRFKNGPFLASFYLFASFQQLTVNSDDEWIRTSGVASNCSVNWATTTAHKYCYNTVFLKGLQPRPQ